METFDIEYNVAKYYAENYKVRFKKEYPKPGENIREKYYHDCSPNFGVVSSFYLEYGIMQIDGWFGKHIREGYDKDKLEFMIKNNPHLHNVIKTNLLDNLYAQHNIKIKQTIWDKTKKLFNNVKNFMGSKLMAL